LTGGVGLTALVNGESASGLGLDLSAAIRPFAGLEVGLNFSWNDLTMDADVLSGGVTLFSKGDRLNYSAQFTGGVSTEYGFAIGSGGLRGRLSASASYSSKQMDHALNGATAIVNTGDDLLILRTGVSLMSPDRWTATVFADNLTNEYGAMPQSLFPIPELSPRVRPRTIGLQLDFRY
jgi:iron complex outermembrane receptor protein